MRIVLVSDTHLTPRTAAFTDNWSIVARWIEAVRPDLVVHLGDITANGASDPDELVAARRVFARFPVPTHFIPGNHDIGDNPLETGASSEHALDLARLDDYRGVFGSDRWTLDAGPWQIVALNAQLFRTGTLEEETQFRWLQARLADRNCPLGVLLHKPLFRHGPDDVEAHIRYVPASARRRLLDLLVIRDLRFVASGHAHQAHRILVAGVEHVWAPSTAFCLLDGMQERIGEKTVGALMLELSDVGHRIELVRP